MSGNGLGEEALRRLRWRSVCAIDPGLTGAELDTMVPVYGHRYLPAGSGTHGHPVLSMMQTDIIYYGLDLADYIDREFGRKGVSVFPHEPQATVPFWRDLV